MGGIYQVCRKFSESFLIVRQSRSAFSIEPLAPPGANRLLKLRASLPGGSYVPGFEIKANA
jgi:hypothetical protein